MMSDFFARVLAKNESSGPSIRPRPVTLYETYQEPGEAPVDLPMPPDEPAGSPALEDNPPPPALPTLEDNPLTPRTQAAMEAGKPAPTSRPTRPAARVDASITRSPAAPDRHMAELAPRPPTGPLPSAGPADRPVTSITQEERAANPTRASVDDTIHAALPGKAGGRAASPAASRPITAGAPPTGKLSPESASLPGMGEPAPGLEPTPGPPRPTHLLQAEPRSLRPREMDEAPFRALPGGAPTGGAPIRPALPAATPTYAQPAVPGPAPTIEVTIGRIEVRAAPPPAQPARERKGPAVMSLEEYMRQREGGRK